MTVKQRPNHRPINRPCDMGMPPYSAMRRAESASINELNYGSINGSIDLLQVPSYVHSLTHTHTLAHPTNQQRKLARKQVNRPPKGHQHLSSLRLSLKTQKVSIISDDAYSSPTRPLAFPVSQNIELLRGFHYIQSPFLMTLTPPPPPPRSPSIGLSQTAGLPRRFHLQQ